MQEPFSKDTDFPAGCIINVDKPFEWTSTDVVRKIKYALHRLGHKRIKIGHAGTLDPLATGVLLICIGKATKRVEELMSERKEYVTDMVLGATTASYDLEHPVDTFFPWEHITRDGVEKALAELCGERYQMPPVYSAKRIDGKRAYEYARESENVELRKALINIYDMELLEFDLPRIRVRIECSRGTYIRALAREVGEKLGSGAYLSSLRRTRSGDFRAEDAMDLKKIIEILSAAKHF